MKLILTILILIAASWAQLPDAPKPGKLFWGEVGAYTAMNVADGFSTLHNIHHGAYESTSPWLYGRYPKAKSYFLPALGMQAGVTVLSYKLQSSHKKGYRMLGHGLMIWQTGEHARGLANNLNAKTIVPTQDCLTLGTCQF